MFPALGELRPVEGGKTLPLRDGCGTLASKADRPSALASLGWGAVREGFMEEGAFELNV